MKTKIYQGTEIKYNIHIAPVGNLSMDNYDFIVEFFCNPRKVVALRKERLIRIDEDNYVARVDSSALGNGDVKLKITASIPDNDFEDGIRTEVVCFDTDTVIYNK